MAEKEEKETTSSNGDEVEEAWGTLEELLLACAVNRHGTNSWDFIAKELQRRMKHAFFPHNCKKKYVDLRRRFHAATGGGGDGEERENDVDDEELLRMVDELRKLRVEELKREVQRHDLSIVSLQLKVKRLEEEREKSFSKAEQTEAATDLRIGPDGNATGTEEKNNGPERSSLDKVITGDSAEDRSFNESNSTNHNKAENKKTDVAALGEERESKSKRKAEEKEDSTNHEPDPVRFRIKTEPVKYGGSESERVGNTSRASRPVELGESVCESKRDSGKQQQSSDVQSSARLSKKKRRRFRGLVGGGSSGDELETEEVSPANKWINVKCHPLIRFLETLQSHKHGSVFQRWLPSQETEKYRNVIRQHIDLDTVQSRLDKGIYSDCHPKFYRDILLIFTNAVLFYRKSSAEHIAARELRKLVIDEIALRTRKSNITQPVKPDPDLQHLEPLVKKPRSSTTMVVCRRRSSSSMQALSESMHKRDDSSQATSKNINKNINYSRNSRVENDHHQKKVDGSNTSNALASRKEKDIEKVGGGGGGVGGGTNAKKVLTKERSSLGRGGLRLSNNNSKKIISKEGNNREKLGKSNSSNKKEESSEGEGAEMVEMRKKMNADQKQEKGTTATLKKQGVANFLKRMKQNSPSSQEKLKNNDSEKEKEKEEEEMGQESREKTTNNGKKRGVNPKRNNGDGDGNGNGNGNGDIEAVTTRGNAGRRGERELAASRKVIGRPPKRKASMMSSTPDSDKGGRSNGRDSGEKSKKKPRR